MSRTKKEADIEANPGLQSLLAEKEERDKRKGNGVVVLVRAQAVEYRVPTRTKVAYLSVYFLCNVGLTVWNKAVLGKVGGFWGLLPHTSCLRFLLFWHSLGEWQGS